MTVTQGEPLTVPPSDARERSRLGHYLGWLAAERGLHFADFSELHSWSVTDLAAFWGSVWDYFGVRAHTGPERVLGSRTMPGATWFPGATLNYAEHALGRPEDADTVAVVAHSQTRDVVTLTFGELRAQVADARAGLQQLGVRRGDRVAAYLPNIPETLVAFLACVSLGAVWTSCAPEFGARSVIDRFAQTEPTVLLTITGYRYGDKTVDRHPQVAEIRAALPTVRHVVHVPYGTDRGDLPEAVSWPDLLAVGDGIDHLPFEPVPFDHPLFILYSSGTTGPPKAIVHGHGGILLEHLKNHAFSWDLGPGDRLLWFSTTAWMMWNALVSALLVRASIVMIDGNPLHPDLDAQWRLAAQTGATLMGASPGYLMACRAAGLQPARTMDLSRLRQIGAAGSPLPPEGYAWVLAQFGPQVLLNVGSGGTDVCTGLVQGSPLQPVWSGAISGACLGVDAKAFDEAGRVVVDRLGELVVTAPMPSMPVGLWGDPDSSRYRATYFDRYPGVWRHGDWAEFRRNGSCVIAGRSDATLNRGGVRLGTAEFYRVVEEFDEVTDSLVVHLEDPAGGNGELLLFVVPRPGVHLDDALRARLATALRTALSPRHLPDAVVQVAAVPRTRTGKKLEVPVKRLLRGEPAEDVLGRDVLADPDALRDFLRLADARGAR
jgi:acetoacetyl-CoA synthetase